MLELSVSGSLLELLSAVFAIGALTAAVSGGFIGAVIWGTDPDLLPTEPLASLDLLSSLVDEQPIIVNASNVIIVLEVQKYFIFIIKEGVIYFLIRYSNNGIFSNIL